MHVLITGAAGMIGRKLAERLAADGALGGTKLDAMTLMDVVPPEAPAGFERATLRTGDLGDPALAPALLAMRPDAVFHLASIVSGGAEADFDGGYRVNLDGTRHLLEAARHAGNRPRFVFASSIAVFGRPFPETIPDEWHTTPRTSYGVQKLCCEKLISDYSRKGFLNGVSIRLPTICVRPGKPNAALSGFFSGIIREPLAGKEAILPVRRDVRHWHASPAAAVGFFLHAATMDTAPLGDDRALSMPGISVTVGEQIESLRRIAGEAVTRLIRDEPDPRVAEVVENWATGFTADRARALGFVADADFDAIIRAHLRDEHGAA